jgi:allantoinase
MQELIVRSERVVFDDGVRPASIVIRDGRLAEVAGYSFDAVNVRRLDVGARAVLPGFVDTHVHVNDPGRTHWEGFDSATRAAAAGGITTIVDMPLNSIPATTTVNALAAKHAAARGRCHVDVAFWGGVVPGNAADLLPLARAGVRGFKCFLSPSGVEEFDHVTAADLREALPAVAATGLPLLVHAELPALLTVPSGDPRHYATWLHSRPPGAERAAIELLIRLAQEHRAWVHIVHLADGDALAAVRAARAAGAALTIETCPHYLTFSAETIEDGATLFKCAPPIRGRRHGEALWQGLDAGDIDLVASDHSPAPPELKHLDTGNFVQAWGGIASLQIGPAAVWTGAARRGFGLDRLGRWMSTAPARLAGLDRRKGRVAPGYDADLVIWDPEARVTIDATRLQHRHAVTPYHGATLQGAATATMLRGEVICQDGEVVGRCAGRLLTGVDA